MYHLFATIDYQVSSFDKMYFGNFHSIELAMERAETLTEYNSYYVVQGQNDTLVQVKSGRRFGSHKIDWVYYEK